MSVEEPPKPRAGKYCPRCHAMTLRDQAVCAQCGHRFRTGVDTPPAETQSAAPDPINRTMQFVLPPLATRAASAPPGEPPPSAPAALPRHRPVWAAALLVLALCAGAALWQHARRGAAPGDASPVGVWQTTLHGRAASDARLQFTFGADGAGQFSWRESAPAALSGRTPLRWRRNGDGTLSLALDRPADGDPISQTFTGIFSSHAWPWRVDRTRRRLVLGTLVFSEKE